VWDVVLLKEMKEGLCRGSSVELLDPELLASVVHVLLLDN
jgi:hypothetical protein